MLGGIIYRDLTILKKEKFYLIAPIFLLAGIVAEFACYLLVSGFVLSIIASKDFKYNIGVLIHSIVEDRKKFVMLRYVALTIYIPVAAIILNGIKLILSGIIQDYEYVFVVESFGVNMLVAAAILSVIFMLSIKLGSEAVGFIFTMMMMGFSAMGLFQKSIDLSAVNYLGLISIVVVVVSLTITTKIYNKKDF